MINHYLTIVNGKYALRALALFKSLEPYLYSHSYAVYCIDQVSFDLLESLKLAKLEVVASNEFETDNYKKLRAQRNLSEYCWTLKPIVLEHAMKTRKNLEWCVYLDSDMLAFCDPNIGLNVREDANVVITPHRFSNEYFARFGELAGQFNAGYAAFKKTDEGKRALAWWKARCIEGTPIKPHNGMYADQKYLDKLGDLFSGVVASTHKGLNAGPWNVIDRSVDLQNDKVLVDGDELLLFHMQGFKVLDNNVFNLYDGPVKIQKMMRKYIYRPYVSFITRAWIELETANKGYYIQQPDNSLRQVKTWLKGIREIIYGRSNLMLSL